MPRQKRVVKKRGKNKVEKKRGLTSTQLFVGIFIFLLAIVVIGVGSIPTANVITGNAERTEISVQDTNGDVNIVICGNGICSSGLGESASNCPSDCGNTKKAIGAQGFFSETLDQWENGTMDASITKYFAFFLVLILVSTILGFMDLPSNKFVRFIFSIIISFLAVAYITPAEVFGVMQTYAAMGLALIAIVPFIILVFFSAQILSEERKNLLGAIILERFLWWSFSLFLLYKIIYLLVIAEGPDLSWVSLVIVVLAFLLSLLFAIKNKWFMDGLMKVFIQSRRLKNKRRDIERAEARADNIGEEVLGDRSRPYSD